MSKFAHLAAITALGIGLTKIGLCQTVDRDSDPLPQISAVLATFESGTGWLKDSAGQWKSEDRMLPDPGSVVSSFVPGYKKFQLRSIKLGSNMYPLLSVTVENTRYKYPITQHDPYRVTNLYYFILDSYPDVAPTTVEFNKSFVVKFNVKYLGLVESVDYMSEIEITDAISREARVADAPAGKRRMDAWTDNGKNPDGGAFQLAVFPVIYKGQHLARFLYFAPKLWPSTWGPVMSLEPETLNKEYFEADWQPFRDFWSAGKSLLVVK